MRTIVILASVLVATSGLHAGGAALPRHAPQDARLAPMQAAQSAFDSAADRELAKKQAQQRSQAPR